MPAGGALRVRQEDRVEHSGGPSQAGVKNRGVRQGVDPVKEDDVVAGQELAQPPEVRRAVLEMEVAQDGNLLHRPSAGRTSRDLVDPRRIGVRPGDLDARPRLGERRRVHRPGDGRHVVAEFDERTCERGEGQDVADRPDRCQGDPHQMALIRRGAVRGP